MYFKSLRKNAKDYMQSCVQQLSPNVIILKENKRLKTDEDKQRLNAIKSDVFDTKQKLKDIFIKHGIIKTAIHHRVSNYYDDYTGENGIRRNYL